ncbi:MAG: hypothetical protein B7Z73_00170 [Planctomycetia bacterium 21-64-5]|nr:MAG: hypothetical protein B7Z73_00170 [Planctomycetia bacterium 21-64-5]HQU41509.1 DUF1571 domain-containing protein [Pirellulales bacterium]
MRTETSSVRRAIALALACSGLWRSPVLAQESRTPGRSVYDRRPAANTMPAEPRRLPTSQAGKSVERGVGRPRRAQGYLSQTPSGPPRTTSGAHPAVRRAVPTPNSMAGGVVPAFFPAPIAGVEPPKAVDANASQQIALQLNSAAPGEHKLLPAVRWAKLCMQKMETVQDYSAKMVKRERIDGTLSDYEYMFVKVRHEPFSVYVSFIGPARVKGQEALFVQGRNEGNLLGHANGMRKIFGTVSLKPDSMLAMAGNRYPITEMGIKRLTERLIEVGEHDAQFGECEVQAFPNTKINGRECVCLQVLHPVPRKEFLFHKAKIYVDSQHNVPVRYEAYDWPREAGGEPLLLEEYTYLDLKLNNGFTDRDFDASNPDYQFR